MERLGPHSAGAAFKPHPRASKHIELRAVQRRGLRDARKVRRARDLARAAARGAAAHALFRRALNLPQSHKIPRKEVR